MFQKIPVELPKPYSPKKKHQSVLHAIGGGWCITKLRQKLPHLNKSKLNKRSQEVKDEIKRKLHKANQYCDYWKFQTHWNKIE